jgi:DNA-binding response OmpR family regulator
VPNRVVLVVEDDPQTQKAMSDQLSRMGFDVVCAMHYDAAVEHLRSTEPDLVCVDLELPTESGYELCEYIRGPRGLDAVPILVTSDSNYPEEMAEAEIAGANAFLRKPFSAQELAHYVAALVDEERRRSSSSMRRLRL